MHILITRPEPDATEMQKMLSIRGISSDVAPLLEITIEPPPAALAREASALVVTSRNGLRALARLPALAEHLHRPLLVVGSGTGAAARELGFTDVTVGPATAKDLVPIIISAWREKIAPSMATPGPVLHLAGDKISFDLSPPLAAAGIPFRRATVYHSKPSDRLPDRVVSCLDRSGYDAIVLMSPLTAETFVDLVRKTGMAAAAKQPTYLCLSKGIAAIAATLGAQKLRLAAKPNIEEMLALISELAALSPRLSPPGDESDTPD